ncbi:restriction endonuclease [Pseudonocardia endophytica]|nr:restriction endonuclease [Pseudonocardia endophytica]
MPTWDGFLVPVLRVLSDGSTRQARDLQDYVADHVGLSDEQRSETIDSGQLRFRNRINWAVSSLTRANALERPRRGSYVITALGEQLLADHPTVLAEHHLRQVPAYRDHVPARRSGTAPDLPTAVAVRHDDLDPIEQIDDGINRVHTEVAAQLLERLRSANPEFLEQSVLDVLVAMGYGGVEQRARRIGGSGDGGVDGVIDQDALGLARIYVQAKRYAAGNSVGRPEVQGFVGALHGHQANQGVFITTSNFTRDATAYAQSVNASIILIDGERLTTLMIRHGVGVQTVQMYSVVKLDEDYFE